MPPTRAQQSARKSPCNYADGFPQPGDKPGAMPHWSDRRLYEKTRRLRHLEGRPLLVDATGTHRRLRALMAIGWRSADLAPRIGWACGELDSLFRRATVRTSTASAVAGVYMHLADVQGPSEQTRRRAARQGWPPPLAWDDDTIDDPQFIAGSSSHQDVVDVVAIERWIDGDTTIALTRAEKHAVFYKLRCAGHTVTAAARQLRLSGSTARRYEATFAEENVHVRQHTPLDTNLEETG